MVKVCARCRRELPWSEYWAAKKFEDGTMSRPMPRCKDCERRRHADRQAADPEKWSRYWRDRMAVKLSDPETAASVLAGQRRRRGVTPDRHRPTRIIHSAAAWAPERVDIAPFLAWMRGVIERDGSTWEATRERLGVPDGVRRAETVDLAIVEAALIADNGATLFDVYGD